MHTAAPPRPLGVIADDLTGACDLAARVVEAGASATVHLGRPHGGMEPGGCAIVALKVRSVPAPDAVAAVRTAAAGLLEAGARQLYQKYCSTFDSTAAGNIGPIADALADMTPDGGPATTVGTPATPASGRTVRDRRLLVDGVPLSETAMRHHPLTPMHDSDLVRVLQAQTRRPVVGLHLDVVRRGATAVRDAIAGMAADGAGHVLADAETEADLDVLTAALVGDGRLIGGAAGLAAALARRAPRAAFPPSLPAAQPSGRLILSGSASSATRAQVRAFPGEVVRVDPLALADGAEDEVIAAAERAIASARGRPVLVSATADPRSVRVAQATLGRATAARLVERALAAVAVRLVPDGTVGHVVVAGGETSGAVAEALGVRSLAIGRSAAPGVPWTVADSPALSRPVALLLKSGNFGDADLFSTAWRTAP